MSNTTATNPAGNRIGAIQVGQIVWRAAEISSPAMMGAVWAVENRKWLGGALEGNFNKKQTTGQIIFDAVISMFPVAGEVTAARDAISIVIDMCEDHSKCKDVWEWVSLALCLVAVVPAVGGLVKGVGKLAIRAIEKLEDLKKLAAEIIKFVNRLSHGNAYEWLRQLDFTRYQTRVMSAVSELVDRLTRACQWIVKNVHELSEKVIRFLASLPSKMQQIRNMASRMVPQALEKLNACLEKVRAHMVEGTWADISVGAGKKSTRESEGRLADVAHEIGKAPHPSASLADYHHVEGWPDLREGNTHVSENPKTGEKIYQTIESFSKERPIKNITLPPGKYSLSRVLDNTMRTTKSGRKLDGIVSERTKRSINWLPRMAENGREWREKWAVKMEWNHNGVYITLDHIPTADELRKAGLSVPVPEDWDGLHVWSGQVSSQYDEDLGRWLAGGETQYIIDFDHPFNKVLEEYVKHLTPKPTNWTDVIFKTPVQAVVVPLDKDEVAAKNVLQGYINRMAATARHGLPGNTSEKQQENR